MSFRPLILVINIQHIVMILSRTVCVLNLGPVSVSRPKAFDRFVSIDCLWGRGERKFWFDTQKLGVIYINSIFNDDLFFPKL